MLLYTGLAATCLAQDAPELGLYLHFDAKPSAVFVRAMEKEVASILSPDVLRLHWVTGEDTNAYSRAVVVRFRGTCRGGPDEVERLRRVTLGTTKVADGRILPFSDVNCDELRAFLKDEAPGGEARLARASARVLAHELYHVLLQTREHGQRGIAKAVHTPAALLSRSLRFEEGELDKLRLLYR